MNKSHSKVILMILKKRSLKYLKMGWNRKEGRESKYFKKGGKLGQSVGALKKRGVGW